MQYLNCQYDWVYEECTDSNRYMRDPHYYWRDFDKENRDEYTIIYSDRMSMWDHEKYHKAVDGFGFPDSLDYTKPKTAKDIIKKYFDGEYVCHGYAVCDNKSTGYAIGIYFCKKKGE